MSIVTTRLRLTDAQGVTVEIDESDIAWSTDAERNQQRATKNVAGHFIVDPECANPKNTSFKDISWYFYFMTLGILSIGFHV